MVRHFIVLFTLLGCVFGAPNAKSGVPMLDGRIVGGFPIDISAVPYQISLLYYGSHICGGSIISANWVITASHCTMGAPASTFSIRAGSSIRDKDGVVISASSVREHSNYNGWTLDSDISIIGLATSLTFGSTISPINLPAVGQEIKTGVDCFVSGWGTLIEGGASLPSNLQGVTVPTVSIEDCRAAYGESKVTDTMMCAGIIGEGGLDACQGDSGGPLVIDGELIGIVSWGYGCARPEYPGVYSSVPALRSFIAENTEI